MKRSWIAFWITLALVLPIRIYAMLRYLNAQTGFYSDGGRVVGAASAVLAAGILLTVLFAARTEVPKISAKPLKSIPVAVCGAIAGAFVLVQSAVGIGAGFLTEGQIFYRIFSYAGILAGVVLLLTAYDFAAGLRTVASRPLVALIPSVWGCIFLVVLFIAYSAAVNLVEDVYHTFTVVFLLLFLFVQAKLLTGIESEKAGKMIFMVGLPAALLMLVTGVPSCIQYFSMGETAGFVSIGLHMANIVLAFYIIAFLFAVHSDDSPAKTEPSAEPAVSRELQQQEKTGETVATAPKEEISLSACVGFLSKSCGSGKKFVGGGSSPFYTPEDPSAKES
ncbi:MAG: hypothetical protein LKJ17_09075 [Oscillospiraceae bacterium]|nr:hypothetical protein [Oscillospiraceae bacterium]